MNTQNQPQKYFLKQVADFYAFLESCLVEYRQISHEQETSEDGCNSLYRKQFPTFVSFFCYRMFGEFGVKSKTHRYGPEITDEEDNIHDGQLRKFYGKSRHLLVQMFYDKQLRFYNKSKSVTQLCRHLIFDMRSFSIVSVGTTKSLDLESEFFRMSRNALTDETNQLTIEEFREGTMVIWNPSLEKFNYDFFQEVDASGNPIVRNEATESTQHLKKDFTISTRRVIGTSTFNTKKTFKDMFDENNQLSGLDLSTIPEGIRENLCLVFCVEHPENRQVNPHSINRNTLVDAYKMSSTIGNFKFTSNILDMYFSAGTRENLESERDTLHNLFLHLYEESYYSYSHDEIRDIFTEVNFTYPEQIESLTFSSYEDMKTHLDSLLSGLSEYDVGYVVKDYRLGTRSKIRNPAYSDLLELRCNIPMNVDEKNKKNLFKAYWTLRQRRQFNVKRFLELYDTDEKIYSKIFNFYKVCIHQLTQTIFNEYQSVNVRKEKQFHELSFELKPLVGSLHKQFLESCRSGEREIVTYERVIQFVNNLEYKQVFWRIFDTQRFQPKEDTELDTSED
jgi:hypothetical protein